MLNFPGQRDSVPEGRRRWEAPPRLLRGGLQMKRLQGAHSKDIGNNKFPRRHVLLRHVIATTEEVTYRIHVLLRWER